MPNLKLRCIIINLLCVIIVLSSNESFAQGFEFWSSGAETNKKITVTLSANLFKDYTGVFIEDYEKFLSDILNELVNHWNLISGNTHIENKYDSIAVRIKENIQKYLWSEQAGFFLTYKKLK